MADRGLFALRKTIDGTAEFCIFQPVIRMHQAAREFVFALRAAFEYLQAMRDRVLNPLVITSLEVQAGHVFHGTPVAAIRLNEQATGTPSRSAIISSMLSGWVAHS